MLVVNHDSCESIQRKRFSHDDKILGDGDETKMTNDQPRIGNQSTHIAYEKRIPTYKHTVSRKCVTEVDKLIHDP
jgi:hypothetical protein